jgi:hypothetical protein
MIPLVRRQHRPCSMPILKNPRFMPHPVTKWKSMRHLEVPPLSSQRIWHHPPTTPCRFHHPSSQQHRLRNKPLVVRTNFVHKCHNCGHSTRVLHWTHRNCGHSIRVLHWTHHHSSLFPIEQTPKPSNNIACDVLFFKKTNDQTPCRVLRGKMSSLPTRICISNSKSKRHRGLPEFVTCFTGETEPRKIGLSFWHSSRLFGTRSFLRVSARVVVVGDGAFLSWDGRYSDGRCWHVCCRNCSRRTCGHIVGTLLLVATTQIRKTTVSDNDASNLA